MLKLWPDLWKGVLEPFFISNFNFLQLIVCSAYWCKITLRNRVHIRWPNSSLYHAHMSHNWWSNAFNWKGNKIFFFADLVTNVVASNNMMCILNYLYTFKIISLTLSEVLMCSLLVLSDINTDFHSLILVGAAMLIKDYFGCRPQL